MSFTESALLRHNPDPGSLSQSQRVLRLSSARNEKHLPSWSPSVDRHRPSSSFFQCISVIMEAFGTFHVPPVVHQCVKLPHAYWSLPEIELT